jgi:transcription termination/antitermination protein NusA
VGDLLQSIEMLAREKGIEADVVLDAVRDAIVLAAKKQYKINEALDVSFEGKGGAQVYKIRQIVEEVTDPLAQWTPAEAAANGHPNAELGSEIRMPLKTTDLGRISAQIARQVIVQKVRDAEREGIFSEYVNRVGEMVTAAVKRMEGPDIIVDIGKTEARLTKREQSRLESFSLGERIRVTIRGVEKGGRNAGLIVSRAMPELVMRLFEQEVPEIYDNTVVIKACAREAGERTKIAVFSRDRDVDSVGACVGMKGMRVQSIIRELRGEKIDIVPYSEDPVQFATAALSPARIASVSILDVMEKHMEVIVEDAQLSLAIGRKGQNVRLAARLLGWKIDIKSQEEKRMEVESQMAALSSGTPVFVLSEHGVPESMLDLLLAGGASTVERIGGMTPEELREIEGIGDDEIQIIANGINAYYTKLDGTAIEETAAPPEAAEAEEAAAVAEAIELPVGEATTSPVAEATTLPVAEATTLPVAEATGEPVSEEISTEETKEKE